MVTMCGGIWITSIVMVGFNGMKTPVPVGVQRWEPWKTEASWLLPLYPWSHRWTCFGEPLPPAAPCGGTASHCSTPISHVLELEW